MNSAIASESGASHRELMRLDNAREEARPAEVERFLSLNHA